jgi:hypothetical protein
MIWDVITHNMNQLVKRGGLDLTLDETTWPNASYADCQGRLKGKKVDKGGQNVLVLDATRRYLYAWSPRHKYFQRPKGFTQEGPAEAMRCFDILKPLIIGEEKDKDDKRRQIFSEGPHLCMDNHFSGDHVMEFLGGEGWKATLTCRRDRLPKECNKLHFHHLKMTPVDGRSRCARFEQPITAVKYVVQPAGSTKKDYTLVHVSMQSTGSTNFSTVNALSKVGLYVRERQKGRGDSKRIWGIEMNEGRETYLKNYSAVDKIDQALKEWMLYYVTWRWWHAPTRHGKAIGKCMGYQLYMQCAEGGVDPDWKVDKPMTAPEYRRKLARQMCEYRARKREYPGDDKMREATQQCKKRRRGRAYEKRLIEALETCDDGSKRVSYDQYLAAKKPRSRAETTRLCSDNIDMLKKHINSYNFKATRAKCQVCGAPCSSRCGTCGLSACFKSERYKSQSVTCSFDLHNDDYFGLTMDDQAKLLGRPKGKFKKATTSEVKANRKHICKLNLQYKLDMDANENN